MEIKTLFALLFITLVGSGMFQKFSLYNTNIDQRTENSDQWMHSCLHYYVLNDIIDYNLLPEPLVHGVTHQIIHYCFRPSEKPEDELHFLNTRNQNFTFDQLQMNNISSHQLYLWSAPIDLVEQYEIYLNNTNSSSEIIYYNCTKPWFGPLCQYSFDLKDHSLQLSDIVKGVFQNKVMRSIGSTEILSNLSCYTYLNCNRGGSFSACLDWREICDGKVDCINGRIDEEHCEQLEINECNENEYRCHNGQCISQDFLADNTFNPECLDTTDESNEFLREYTSLCISDPAFRCEDIKCRPSVDKNIPCGDGECTDHKCENQRDVLLKKAMIESTIHINDSCRDIMVCLTGLNDCKTKLNITKHCSELFQFPEDPILFGHVKLLYTNNQSESKVANILLPLYVCYDARLCHFFSSDSVGNYSNCQRIDQVIFRLDVASWKDMITELKNVFYTCSVTEDGYCYHSHMLYHCNSTVSKCISKHRLLDGIQDCILNDDETYVDSCLLGNRKQRFHCGNRCFSRFLSKDITLNCPNNDDENSFEMLRTQNYTYFSTVCDGIINLPAPLLIYGENYTDESECDLWPCVNTYTRCDGIWNCFNGEDEVDCAPSICPPRQHTCISPLNYTLICLPIEKAGDNIVDCVGASDERHLCRMSQPQSRGARFWCSNDTLCAWTMYLCAVPSQCAHDEDAQLCSITSWPCERFDTDMTDFERFLCSLTDERIQPVPPLSLRYSRIYPDEIENSNETTYIVSNRQTNIHRHDIEFIYLGKDEKWYWHCNRGLNLVVRYGNNNSQKRCLCPPSYYGDRCQYQNQRVSVTLQVRVSSDWQTLFAIILLLIDDDEQLINSYDQIQYLSIRDCDIKFNNYLLYSTRPKNISKNYSVRLDVFDRHSLNHRASWLFPIKFSFLPVHRLAIQITIPTHAMEVCSYDCGINGQCGKYQNMEKHFCRCNRNWHGSVCNIPYTCNCSPGSVCISPSICLCPIEKFGPRCYINRNICRSDSCMNNGTCVSSDIDISEDSITCICPDGISGSRCQFIDTQIHISFQGIPILPYILIHFIEVFDRNQSKPHIRTTSFKKLGIYQNSVTISRAAPFHIVLIELSKSYYLSVLQERFTPSSIISTEVIVSRQCLFIDELFNDSFIKLHQIRRIKYYHIPCQERPSLACFYDVTQICLCNLYQQANCFEFDHNMTYDCRQINYCENGGQCFRDNLRCPTRSSCFCADCYYGSRCQFSTKGFSLSLDIILGYHILPNVDFKDQPSVVIVSITLTVIIALAGFINSLLSIFTFQSENLRYVGCGVYIFISSIASFLTMIMFVVKVWHLVISQMTSITNQSFLQITCSLVDFLLRVFLTTSDWLNACVAVERVVTIVQGIRFDARQSGRYAKFTVILVVLFIVGTSLQDLIHRQLIYDEEEKRTWCTTKYSTSTQVFDSVMILLHFLLPFGINLISPLIIILIVARKRSITQKHRPYKHHFIEQLQEHKHLFISSCTFVIIALPRLIISFLSGCMKSARNPWMFLIGYFISFISSTLGFVVFVLPSNLYKKEFKKRARRFQQKIYCT